MKSYILLLLLIAGFSGKGQAAYGDQQIHNLHERIVYLEQAIMGGADSMQLYPSLQARVHQLQKRVDYLTRDLLETHRRLDSLIMEMRKPPIIEPPIDTVITFNKKTHKNDTTFIIIHSL